MSADLTSSHFMSADLTSFLSLSLSLSLANFSSLLWWGRWPQAITNRDSLALNDARSAKTAEILRF